MKYKGRVKKYMREYRRKHRKRLYKQNKLWKDKNKDKVKKYSEKSCKKYYNTHKWCISYQGAKARCNDKNHKAYKYYGGKGIKFLMTIQDFKYLWKRDNADKMKRPSIDRKNNDRNYILENCQFIELSKNCKKRKTAIKLNKKQVKQIRKLYKTGEYSHRKLGIKFKVSWHNIYAIINNKIWKDV